MTSIAIIPTPAGDSIGLAVISMGETRGSEPQRSASWDIMSVTLRGHIQDARLVASEDTSAVLRPLPGVSGGDDVALRGQADPYVEPPAFGDLFQRAAAERLTLILSTDIPARPVVVLPLQVLQFNDWGRAHCS